MAPGEIIGVTFVDDDRIGREAAQARPLVQGVHLLRRESGKHVDPIQKVHNNVLPSMCAQR